MAMLVALLWAYGGSPRVVRSWTGAAPPTVVRIRVDPFPETYASGIGELEKVERSARVIEEGAVPMGRP
jgi:hypothetical protein